LIPKIFKVFTFSLSLVLIYTYLISYFDFITLSPDSVRFIHFWQNAFFADQDNLFMSHNYFVNLFNSMSNAIQASNFYDLGRGRLVMYGLYGLDSIFFRSFEILPLNLVIFCVMLLNSNAVAMLITRHASSAKTDIYFLTFFIILINAISLSTTMYFAIYGKYICLTFILYFFVFQSQFLRLFMLALASFTDEIGMFCALIICFTYFLRYSLSRSEGAEITFVKFLNKIFLSSLACFLLMISFFLCVFFFLDSTPFQFPKYAARGVIWLLDPWILFEKLLQIVWSIEIFLIGSSLESKSILFIPAVFLLGFAIFHLKKIVQKGFESNLSNCIIFFQNFTFSSKKYLLIFWLVVTFLMLAALPASIFSYQTYSYPLFLSVSIVLLLILLMKLDSKNLRNLMLVICGLHILTLPYMASNINSSNSNHLLQDSSVLPSEIVQMHIAINNIRKNQNYELFDVINNYQEIDFSGMWYYSYNEHYKSSFKIDDFGNTVLEEKYFPILGNVRVMAWPYFDRNLTERKFLKNKPQYFDEIIDDQ